MLCEPHHLSLAQPAPAGQHFGEIRLGAEQVRQIRLAQPVALHQKPQSLHGRRHPDRVPFFLIPLNQIREDLQVLLFPRRQRFTASQLIDDCNGLVQVPLAVNRNQWKTVHQGKTRSHDLIPRTCLSTARRLSARKRSLIHLAPQGKGSLYCGHGQIHGAASAESTARGRTGSPEPDSQRAGLSRRPPQTPGPWPPGRNRGVRPAHLRTPA